MPRVTGIGGIFFKARNPDKLREWYRDHLDLNILTWGGATFRWREPNGATVWSIFPESSDYFGAGTQPYMINYRVENLEAVLSALRAEGCDVDPHTETSKYGSFGWVTDPEDNRIELWQPPSGRFPD